MPKVGSLVIGLCDNKEFIYNRKCFDETIYVDFEGYKLPIPVGYEKILNVYFGDNCMEPKIYPSDHGSVYFDPHVCYKQYLPKLRKDYSLFSRIKRAILQSLVVPLLANLKENYISYKQGLYERI